MAEMQLTTVRDIQAKSLIKNEPEIHSATSSSLCEDDIPNLSLATPSLMNLNDQNDHKAVIEKH